MTTYQMTNDQTLQSVIETVCSLSSLPIPNDAAGSADPNIVLMKTASNLASLEMLNTYEWSTLTKMAEIEVFNAAPPSTGGATETAFDLPGDFYRFIDQTQWNGAVRLPARGPLSPQGWMAYLVMPITSVFTLTWQVRENEVWFLNPPAPPGQPFRFMYFSRGTVIDQDDASLLKNVAVKNGDIFRLDPALVIALSTQKWMAWNGFDDAAAARDYTILYDARVGAMKAAPILSAVRFGGLHLINAANVPATGYGTSP